MDVVSMWGDDLSLGVEKKTSPIRSVRRI